MGEQYKFRNIAALVTYDGTDFFGFQYQTNHQSVQGALETALSKFCKYSGRIVGSGRTDTGVHARGQVVSIRVEWNHDLKAFLRAWNVHLPQSILIRSVCEVSEAFHPRFDALTRTYCYYVTNNLDQSSAMIQRSPLTDRTCLYVSTPLDVEAMNSASQCLLGIHDFAAFGQPTHGDSTIRELTEAYWQVLPVESPMILVSNQRRLVFTVTGNAFLRHMVRNLVGTLLLVGTHRIDLNEFQEILGSKQRERSAPPVPPNGLVLEKVDYPMDYGVRF